MKECKRCKTEFSSHNPRKIFCTVDCHYLFYALAKRKGADTTLATNLENEYWVDVNGYEGIYQVSNMGRIKSYSRLLSVDSIGRLRVLSADKFGYIRCGLNKDDKRTTIKVHRLVAEHFIPNPENKEQVNHKNMIKSDNRVENLEWATRSENTKHSYDNDSKRVRQFGVLCHFSKLNNSDIINIFRLNSEGNSRLEISKIYNIHTKTLSRILTRKSWCHVQIPNEYIKLKN